MDSKLVLLVLSFVFFTGFSKVLDKDFNHKDLDSIGSFDSDSDSRLFIEDKTENKKKKPNKKPSSNIDPCLININKAYDECIKLCQDRIHDQSYQRECITICNDSIGKFVPE